MSFSFIDIEEKTSRTIAALFLVLVLCYFAIAWLLFIPVKWVFFFSPWPPHSLWPTLSESLAVLVIAIIAGSIHWTISTQGLIERITGALKAQPLDLDDEFHRRFHHVVEEAAIAAGGMPIECLVLPTTALNAFAMAEFSGRKVIGVTEGLLAKLNRAQLEGVVGHELAHLVSGDSLMTGVTVSLFGLYAGMMRLVGQSIRDMFSSPRRGRRDGRVVLLLVLIYAILGLSRPFVTILKMFVSRERELRADAVAVRLTRHPLALAEALHIISRGWRGASLGHDYLSALFILNPAVRELDEREGFWANLFSTHPPLSRRLEILLGMAGSSSSDLIRNLERQRIAARKRRGNTIRERPRPVEEWFVLGPSRTWEGPYGIEQLRAFSWLTPDTWVRQSAESPVTYASNERAIRQMFLGRRDAGQTDSCPHCGVSMTNIRYESVPLLRCSRCGGILAERLNIPRILVREEQEFSPLVQRQAGVIRKEMSNPRRQKEIMAQQPTFALSCSRCEKKMQRRHYSYAYPVMVDVCPQCHLYWFDPGELELLQCLYETSGEALDV